MSDAYRQMSRNPILVKDDVGKAKPSVYDLPPESHAYGRSEMPDIEGAREVTMHWAVHVPKPKPGPQGQDFKLINKMATRSKVTNAKQLADCRRSGVLDFPLTQQGPAGVLPKVIPSDVIPSFAYGRKSRPSTPINAVVGGGYAAEYEEALDGSYRTYAEIQGPPGGARKVRLTRASKDRIHDARTRKALENVVPREPFKMKKFTKVPSRLGLATLAQSSPSAFEYREYSPAAALRSSASSPALMSGEM